MVAQSLVVSPEREWVAVFLSGGGIDEIELRVLSVVLEVFQDPGFDLGAAVGEGDFVEIVLDYGFGFGGGLFRDNGRWSRGTCGSHSGRLGGSRCGLRGHGLIRGLGRCWRRHVFLEQRLGNNEDDER